MAGATGLEPAASGVTGRRSNQLSYAPNVGSGADLNLTPRQVKRGGLFPLRSPRKNALEPWKQGVSGMSRIV